MSETVESLNKKIFDIRNSLDYKNLVIKQRGPLEERKLRELNLRINAFESQKKTLKTSQTPGFDAIRRVPKILAAPQLAVKKGLIKPQAPRVVMQSRPRLQYAPQLEEKPAPGPYKGAQPWSRTTPPPQPLINARKIRPPSIATPIRAPFQRPVNLPFKRMPMAKIQAATRRGMAPLPRPVPPIRASRYSTINKNGHPAARGATHAVPRAAAKPPLKISAEKKIEPLTPAYDDLLDNMPEEDLADL